MTKTSSVASQARLQHDTARVELLLTELRLPAMKALFHEQTGFILSIRPDP
jgi:hypothetical protein